MIPFDFEYYQPNSVEEAIQTIHLMADGGQRYMFYNGGTEFITFARLNQIVVDAVIDIKQIPECNVLQIHEGQAVIGAAVTLNKIISSGLFPLLGEVVKRVADHTSRNKITIGGNISSQLMYREGILPLLLCDAKVKLNGRKGETVIPLNDVFQKEMKLEQDQFLVQILVEKDFLELPFVAWKKTKMTKVGYPIVSIAALVKHHFIRLAFSGVCEYPFRSTEVEALLNDPSLPVEERIHRITTYLPSPIIEDTQGSDAYREFVLKNALRETIEALERAI
ncbi:Carbon monoxide dehydrogenase medium chain [compost metagenome]